MPLEDLKTAQQLLKRGDTEGAGSLLKKYIREQPNDPRGWFLAHHAAADAAQKKRLLERALQADPGFEPAKRELAKLQQPADDFLFDDFDEDVPLRGSSAPAVQRPKKSGGTPILAYIAIGFGVLVLLCGGTLFMMRTAVDSFFNQVFENVTWESVEGTNLENAGVFQGHSWTVIQKGSINVGGAVNNTVDTFDDDGWLLTGSAGQRITIDLVATDGQLDPQLYLYAPDGRLIAENDDIDFMNDNMNSRITISLPENGTYGIVASAFGSGGSYQLSVR